MGFVLDVNKLHVMTIRMMNPTSQGELDRGVDVRGDLGFEVRGSEEASNESVHSLVEASIHLENGMLAE